jgi:hypothetical protein
MVYVYRIMPSASLDAQVLAKEPIRGVNLTRLLEASKDVEDEVGGDGGR